MPMSTPVTTFDQEYSDPAATATEWEETCRALEEAQLFWVSTVRADGRHAGHADILREQLDGAIGTGPESTAFLDADAVYWKSRYAKVEQAAKAGCWQQSAGGGRPRKPKDPRSAGVTVGTA
jgi:hypothetical protein